MPDSFAHQLRREGLESNPHRGASVALENAEARIQKFPDRKIRRPTETRPVPARFANPRDGKSPQLLPGQVESEEIPLVIDAAEMIRPHPPLFRRAPAQLAIAKFNLRRVEHRMAQHLEDLEVGLALPDGAK